MVTSTTGVAFDGLGFTNPNVQRGATTCVLFGDSISEYYNSVTGSFTDLRQINGIATATLAGHGLAIDDLIRPNNATNTNFNVLANVLTVPSSSVFTYAVDPTTTTYIDNSTSTYTPLFYRTSAGSYFAQLQSMSNQAFTLLYNGGLGGNTSAQMNARVIHDAVSYGPRIAFIQSGTNDIYAANLTNAAIKTNDTVNYTALLNAGVFCVVLSIPPHSVVTPGSPTAAEILQQQQIMEINRWRAEWWSGRTGGVYVDTYSPIVNSTNAEPASGMLKDGVHDNNQSAYLKAKAIWNTIKNICPSTNNRLPASIKDCYGTNTSNRNINDNSLMIAGGPITAGAFVNTAGGTTSGTVADGYNCTLAVGAGVGVTASIVARTLAADGDTCGNNQHLVITSTANNDQVSFSINTTTTALKNRVTNGDYVYMEVPLIFTSVTNLKGIQLTLLTQTATTANKIATCESYVSTDVAYPDTAFNKTLRTPVLQIRTPSSVHGAVSALTAQIDLYFAGSGGATVDISKLVVIKNPTTIWK